MQKIAALAGRAVTQARDVNVISRIPRSIQVATTGRGRMLDSPVGKLEFFKIKPELMRDGSGFRKREFERLLRERPYPNRIRSAIQSRWRTIFARIQATVSVSIPPGPGKLDAAGQGDDVVASLRQTM